MFFESSRIFGNKSRSALAEGEQVQETPAGDGQQPRQRAMQRRQRARMTPDEVRDDRDGRKDAAAADQPEARRPPELQVFSDRTVARMFVLGRGADQPPAQQELNARLQVREVRDRNEQLAARPQDAKNLGQ